MDPERTAEYCALWDELAAELDPSLQDALELGMVAGREKIPMNAFLELEQDQRDLIQLRRELEAADAEYVNKVREIHAAMPYKEDTSPRTEDWVLRATDFLRGVIVSFNEDYAANEGLRHLMQQVHLIQSRPAPTAGSVPAPSPAPLSARNENP